MPFISIGEAARRLSDVENVVQPRCISDLFYARKLRDDLCPLVGGRRMIPADYLDVIAMELRRAGKLPVKAVTDAR